MLAMRACAWSKSPEVLPEGRDGDINQGVLPKSGGSLLRSILRFLFGHQTGFRGKKDYLVEIRLYGPVKRYAKNVIYEVARRFRVSGNTKRRAVPHVTLYGPFSTTNQERLISTIKKTCEKHSFDGKWDSLVVYRVSGFNSFNGDGGKVVGLDIIPSKELNDLTIELGEELNRFCDGQSWDRRGEKLYHSTIAFRDIDRKHDEIMAFLGTFKAPRSDYPLIRITLLHRGKILYEYDLIQDRLLNRNQALNHDIFRKSISKVIGVLYEEKPGLILKERRGFQKKKHWRARRRPR